MFRRIACIFVATFTLAVLVSVPDSRAQEALSGVPTVWLDSLEANLWRMDSTRHPLSYRIKETDQELNDDGTPSGTTVRYYSIRIRADGTEERTECDSLGASLAKKSTSEKSVSMSVNDPLDAVRQVSRSKYTFTLGVPDEQGRPRFSFRLRPEIKNGFNGNVTIDTTVWYAVRVSGAPRVLPSKHMNSFHMDLEFEPADSGYFRLHKMTAVVKGRYLLFPFHQRIVEEYYDYH